VTLDHLDTSRKQEVVHARYVVGCDGKTSLCSPCGIQNRDVRRCAFMGAQSPGNHYGRGADRLVALTTLGLGVALRCPPLDSIWGVVDIIADTDFPDVRNFSIIHSTSGSCILIPREEDKIRFYIQLSDSDILDPTTGLVDKNSMSSKKLLEVRTSMT
jgi:phenol 2-monooxygenase